MNARGRRVRLRVLFVALTVAGCGRRTSTTATATANATTTTTTTTTTTATTSDAGMSGLRGRRGCRVQMLRGAVSIRSPTGTAGSLGTGDAIENGAWLDVAEGAEITVRTSSYREITISGPALAAVCPNGEDELLVAKGRVSAFPGTGVRPGVEVWIATPLGVVRYSDAKIEVVVADASRVTVTAAMARADFAPAPGIRIARGTAEDAQAPSSPFIELALRPEAPMVAERASAPIHSFLPDLVHACARESEASQKAAEALLSGDGGAAALGERATAQVRARQRARFACETARAAAGPGALDESLLAELRAADEKRNQLTPLPARR